MKHLAGEGKTGNPNEAGVPSLGRGAVLVYVRRRCGTIGRSAAT